MKLPPLPCDAGLFLAHEKPLLLLDELLFISEERARCRVDTSSDCIFSSDGYFEPVVAVEWMAQTVGVYVGAGRFRAGKDPHIGFIIGCPEIHFHVERIWVETPIVVDVEPIWAEENSGIFSCSVREQSAETLLVQGRLAAYEPNL